ncbi:AraC-like DNA-binding protein [Paenibacillus sp. SORGH_AS306]|uniref:AraC family transcriptional regulator n=1 Tax=unclassified Paenibacillus TaxID=185978 RepID=UPI00277EADD0|nr:MULTISPECIES: AraC family transcriptional regulator [unclassified Paenibacillus]MDQ1234193.1 AraC-like DNA-binding protein [Paenibacillus sp. SORGH_AS_0306]MDR6111238.1 AraC-like DNA-binding protein [Paenibacillus sp. SORGH_AS_0338]
MSQEMQHKKDELASLIKRHSTAEGVQETAISSLFFVRYLYTTEPAYHVARPALCFIAQGSKEIYLAKERFLYNPNDYLVGSMNLPVVGQIIKASAEEPYVSFKLEFTQQQILDVLKDSSIQTVTGEYAERALFVGQINAGLLDSILRLARLLDHPEDIPFLAPLCIKEILYRLLQSEYGSTLAQSAMEGSSTYRIQDAIQYIMNHYDQSLSIETLAEVASMSISSFHRNFKDITTMTPLQFQKQLRLQEARRLLLAESADAADVAFRLGYESASQFSREYARMFGSPPRTDIKRLKEKYELTFNL